MIRSARQLIAADLRLIIALDYANVNGKQTVAVGRRPQMAHRQRYWGGGAGVGGFTKGEGLGWEVELICIRGRFVKASSYFY